MAETEEEAPTKKKEGGGKGLMIILSVVNLLGLGALGGFMVLSSKHAAPAAGGHGGGGGHGEEAAAAPTPEMPPAHRGVLVQVDPIIANLLGDGQNRYVKVTLHLEVPDDASKERLNGMIVQIRDGVLTRLASLTATEALDPTARETLREDVTKIANDVLGVRLVQRVYFSELVVQ